MKSFRPTVCFVPLDTRNVTSNVESEKVLQRKITVIYFSTERSALPIMWWNGFKETHIKVKKLDQEHTRPVRDRSW